MEDIAPGVGDEAAEALEAEPRQEAGGAGLAQLGAGVVQVPARRGHIRAALAGHGHQLVETIHGAPFRGRGPHGVRPCVEEGAQGGKTEERPDAHGIAP